MRTGWIGAGGIAIAIACGAAVAQTPAPAQPPLARQIAIDALKKRPWQASLRAVITETSTQAKSRLDPAFEDLWDEQQVIAEAEKRIESGLREGRPPSVGAVNDALDLAASGIASRAGCLAAFIQRPDFRQQAAALGALKAQGRTPEPFRSAILEYAGAPCDAPQMGREFDPRRVWENGRKLFNTAASGGGMRTLARYLDDRGLLRPLARDPKSEARAQVDADFRHFDALYDGHAELLRNYRLLFGSYCPTDQRFCALRDMLAVWGERDRYCDEVVKYVSTYYGDLSRRGYLPGAENDGLNRGWEAYHLKFAPACIAAAERYDLVPLVQQRLDLMTPLFEGNSTTLGENGVAKLREATRAIATAKRDADDAALRIRTYRAATGLDQPGAGAPAAATLSIETPPSDDDLKVAGSEATERELKLDRPQIVDLQERLVAIGGTLPIGGYMTQSTRAAIKSWQGAVGLEPSGFLTRPQLDLLRQRTQDRWAQWRATRNAAVEAPPPREPRRRQARRPAGPRYSDNPEPGYVLPRGAIRPRGGYGGSDIPGAIPAYRVWN